MTILAQTPDKLAHEINSEHDRAQGLAQQALGHALRPAQVAPRGRVPPMTTAEQSPLSMATAYVLRGFAVVPIPFKEKIPVVKKWESLRLQESDLPHHFNGQPMNMGAILGTASGGLIDVDLDHPAALAAADFLPETPAIFGRASNPASHRLYRVSGVLRTKQFRDPADRAMLVEVRGEGSKGPGAQTVLPGSTHPSGEVVRWDSEGEPAEAEGSPLVASAGKVAAAALLAKHWPTEGARHESEMALCGMLLQAGMNVDEVAEFVCVVATAGGSTADDFRRRNTARTTADRLKAGEEIKGKGTLEELLGDNGKKIARKACEWLGIQLSTRRKRAAVPREGDTFWTELGNAQRLVATRGKDMMHVRGVGFRVWNGTHWEEDETGQVVRWAKAEARKLWEKISTSGDPDTAYRHCTRSESSSGINGTMKLTETEPGIPVAVDALDSDPYLLNTRQGTIDLRTGECRPHDRADRITRCLDIDYDPDARAPLFERFLEEIQPNPDMRAYLQRQAGYAATGVVSEQELLIPWGGGANGKSVFVDLQLHVLGPYAGTAPDSLLTAKTFQEHPTELADLQGKRLVVASETEEGAKLRIQLVKKLTGDERIKARRMRQDFFEFRRTCKFWLVTNNKPVVDEGTHAVWRRLRLVPFGVTIPPAQRDRDLLSKLKDEAAGVLAWMIRGAVEWHKSGMQTPNAVREATLTYRAESDRLADYRERLVTGDGYKVTRSDLFDDYLEWTKEAGEHDRLSDKAFYARVRQIPGVEDGKWQDAFGKIVRGFRGVGIGWKNDQQREAA